MSTHGNASDAASPAGSSYRPLGAVAIGTTVAPAAGSARTGAGQSSSRLAGVQTSRAVGLGLADAPADDAATLGAGAGEPRVVDPEVPLAASGPAVQAVARTTAITTMAAIGDAIRRIERSISIS